MKNLNIFRVIKHTFNNRWEVKQEFYLIEQRKRFLGFKYWSVLKEEQYCSIFRTIETSPMSFNTESDAIYAIKKLQNGNKPEGWTEEVTQILDFNKK